VSFTITIISTVPTESPTANKIRFNFKMVVLPPTFPQPRDHHLHHVFVSLPTVLHRIVPKIPQTLFPRPRVGCGGHSFYTIEEARLASEDNTGPGAGGDGGRSPHHHHHHVGQRELIGDGPGVCDRDACRMKITGSAEYL
jgi:hypothetical protein